MHHFTLVRYGQIPVNRRTTQSFTSRQGILSEMEVLKTLDQVSRLLALESTATGNTLESIFQRIKKGDRLLYHRRCRNFSFTVNMPWHRLEQNENRFTLSQKQCSCPGIDPLCAQTTGKYVTLGPDLLLMRKVGTRQSKVKH